MKKEDNFEELMKNIDFTRWLQALIPVMQPIIIFGSWLGFSMIDKKASAVSKLIALAEPIPTIDLNVPKPVVLASLYHSTDVALKILKDIIQYFEDLDIPSADEIIDDIKEEILDPLDPIIKPTKSFLEALSVCNENAKKLKYGSYYILGPAWILACMQKKGFKITIDYIRKKYF